MAEEWLLPGEEDVSSPLDSYVVSFAHFHEHGFATPTHIFLWGLLHYYKIKVHHLNPNGIQHMVVWVFVGRDGSLDLGVSRGKVPPPEAG